MKVLERELEVVQTQNITLRKQSLASEGKNAEVEETKGGNVLGTGPTRNDLCSQLHNKWEAEKKLIKRVSTLEQRLQEKVSEVEELQIQLARLRDQRVIADTQQSLAASKNKSQKPATASSTALGKEVYNQMEKEVEMLRSRLFELEEEAMSWRKKAEVEQVNEIQALRHQISVARNRINELRADIRSSSTKGSLIDFFNVFIFHRLL